MPGKIVASLFLVATLPVAAIAQDATGTTTTIDNNEPAAAEDPLATREQRLAVPPLNWDETRGEGLSPRAVQEPETISPVPGDAGTSTGGAAAPEADTEIAMPCTGRMANNRQPKPLQMRHSQKRLAPNSAVPDVVIYAIHSAVVTLWPSLSSDKRSCWTRNEGSDSVISIRAAAIRSSLPPIEQGKAVIVRAPESKCAVAPLIQYFQ